MKTELATVNVEEGFYPRFSEAFRQHYGPDSVFVRATADNFTFALSRLLAANGQLVEGTSIPLLAPEPARLVLKRLIHSVWAVRNLLLQEAFGSIPLGSFATAVDGILGSEFFSRWLSAIESQDFPAANRLLPDDQKS